MEKQETLGIGSRIEHDEFGLGVIIQIKFSTYLISFIEWGIKEISRDYAGIEVVAAIPTPDDLVSFYEMEKTFKRLLREIADVQEIVPIAEKWQGGKLIFQPADKELKGHEIPISTFFHKVVMVRDRLRVMEQRINSSDLPDEEKVNLQQYITRIYGSLTSFNVLFRHRSENFTGIRS